MSNNAVLFKIKYFNKDVTIQDVNKIDIINSLNEHFRTNKQNVDIISVSLNKDTELLTAEFNPRSNLVLVDYKNFRLKVNDKYEIRIQSMNELENKSSVRSISQSNRLNSKKKRKKNKECKLFSKDKDDTKDGEKLECLKREIIKDSELSKLLKEPIKMMIFQ